jgi:hypothetical protein
MFEKALISRAGVERQVDLGTIAETLFFYGKTHFLLDMSSIIALAKQLDRDVLLELFDRDIVSLSYIRDRFSVLTQGLPPVHDFAVIRFGGRQQKRVKNHREEIAEALERELGKSRDTRTLAKAIGDRVDLHRFRGVPEGEKVIPNMMRSDIEDAEFAQSAASTVLSHLVPGFNKQSNFEFRLMKTSEGNYLLMSNLDFEALNKEYHKIVSPTHSSVTTGHILALIQDARADTFFASYYLAEPVTSPISSDLMKLKHFEFLRRRHINAEDTSLFHEIVVPEFPSIKEVINSSERSMKEFMRLLDEAGKFKKWLIEASPDVGLIQSYYKEVTKKSWVDKLPGKVIRFTVAASAGFAASLATGNPAAGLGVSGANTFLADRLLKGWRPNRFVQGPYAHFVGGS